MRLTLLFIHFIVLCPLFATQSLAEVVLIEKNEYYTVGGKGKQEILKNMQRRAPFKKADSYVPAFTQTDLQYKYSGKQHGNRCGVTDVKVILTLTYKYPKLGQHQSSKTNWWWRDLMKHYTTHEEIHGDISKRWAYELDRTLRSLTDLNCTSARDTVKKRAAYIYRKLQEEQKEYDRITDHGQKQHKYKGP